MVGGHCIGVDPYYLTHKAEAIGYFPEFVLSGRRINAGMAVYVAEHLVREMIHQSIRVPNSKILVLGFTFKENCPDIRNTQVVNLIESLNSYGINVDAYDPWADSEEVEKEFGIKLLEELDPNNYEAIVLAVAHHQFIELKSEEIKRLGAPGCLIFDLKSVWQKT